jgi:pimeloyl-ACP methyl ester carboxylesterase
MRRALRRAPAAALLGLLLSAGDPLASGEVVAGRLPFRGGDLYYEVAGAGDPVVLIHGGQMDRRMWDAEFALLAKSMRVLRYDVRGYGLSEMPSRPYSRAEDLLALLDHLGIDRPVLVGLSLGGSVSIDFALSHPDRVRALVLAGPGLEGYAWSRESAERYYATLRAAQAEENDRTTELWLADPCMAPAMENPAIAPRIRELCLANARVWLMNPFLERSLDPPAASRLGEIRAPTLVILGERDAPDLHAVVDLIAKNVPGARKVVIPGAGHIVNMEKPAAFREALLGFLADLPKP